MAEELDPNALAVLSGELAQWNAKSYADLQMALSDALAQETCCVHYDSEKPGGPYKVQVEPLECRPDYLHVLVGVSGPGGQWVSTSFIRYADGRLD